MLSISVHGPRMTVIFTVAVYAVVLFRGTSTLPLNVIIALVLLPEASVLVLSTDEELKLPLKAEALLPMTLTLRVTEASEGLKIAKLVTYCGRVVEL